MFQGFFEAVHGRQALLVKLPEVSLKIRETVEAQALCESNNGCLADPCFSPHGGGREKNGIFEIMEDIFENLLLCWC